MSNNTEVTSRGVSLRLHDAKSLAGLCDFPWTASARSTLSIFRSCPLGHLAGHIEHAVDEHVPQGAEHGHDRPLPTDLDQVHVHEGVPRPICVGVDGIRRLHTMRPDLRRSTCGTPVAATRRSAIATNKPTDVPPLPIKRPVAREGDGVAAPHITSSLEAFRYSLGERQALPELDVFEHGGALTICAHLPALNLEEASIRVTDNYVRVEGQRWCPAALRGKRVHVSGSNRWRRCVDPPRAFALSASHAPESLPDR